MLFEEKIKECSKKIVDATKGNNGKTLIKAITKCPDILKEKTWGHAIANCDVGKIPYLFTTIINCCTGNQKIDVLANALVYCGLKKDENRFNDLCNNSKDFNIGAILAKAMAISAKDENKRVFLMVQNASHGLERSVYPQAMAIAAMENHEGALKIILEACFKGLKEKMLGHAMATCIIFQNKEGVNLLKTICPEGLAEEMYSLTLETCAGYRNEDAIKIAREECPKYLKGTMFGNALATFALNKNSTCFDLIKNNCLPEHKEAMLTQAMITCAKKLNSRAIEIIKNECPPKLIETILVQTMANLAIDNDEALEMLKNTCPENLKVKIDTMGKWIALNKPTTIYKKKDDIKITPTCKKELIHDDAKTYRIKLP